MVRKRYQLFHTYPSISKRNVLCDALIERENTLTNYIYAQSYKLKALFRDEKKPILYSDIAKESIYKDIKVLFDFMILEETIRIREIHTFNHIETRFNMIKSEETIALQKKYTKTIENQLDGQNDLMNTLLTINKYRIKHMKLKKTEKKNNVTGSEQDIFTLINQMYELHELILKKVEFLYLIGFINPSNEKIFHNFFRMTDTCTQLVKDILSSIQLENSFITNNLRQNIILYMKLKNRIYLILGNTDKSIIRTETIESGVDSIWLSKKIKHSPRTKPKWRRSDRKK